MAEWARLKSKKEQKENFLQFFVISTANGVSSVLETRLVLKFHRKESYKS